MSIDILAWLELDFFCFARDEHEMNVPRWLYLCFFLFRLRMLKIKMYKFTIRLEYSFSFISDIDWQRCENIIVILMIRNVSSSDSPPLKLELRANSKKIMSCNFYDSFLWTWRAFTAFREFFNLKFYDCLDDHGKIKSLLKASKQASMLIKTAWRQRQMEDGDCIWCRHKTTHNYYEQKYFLKSLFFNLR